MRLKGNKNQFRMIITMIIKNINQTRVIIKKEMKPNSNQT